MILLAIALVAQPNVVLVTIDTLRADHVGTYGAPSGSTPVLDDLAAEGLRFENAITPVPLTRPAHASLLTGLYPPEHGIRDNLPAKLDSSIPTLATRTKAAGYHTAAFVGSFLLGRGSGFEAGFDVFGDGSASSSGGTGDRVGASAERRAGEVAGEALQYLSTAPSPFFLWVHFYDPHAPYDPPGAFAGKGYAGEVGYVDSQVGRIVEGLRLRGVLDSTLVVVTADHGEALGGHGEDEHGILVYEETLRVPLLVRGPGFPARRVVSEPVSLVDVPRIVLEGVSTPERESLYFESYYGNLHFGWAPLRGIREGSMKLIFSTRPELYDLGTDPREARDISTERQDVARRLYAELEKVSQKKPPPGAQLNPGDLERLASLGYVGAASKKETGADPKDEIAKLTDFGRKLREAISAFHRGEFRSALPLFEELASRDIQSFEVHIYLARCYRLGGNLKDALREYEAAAVIYDGFSMLHLEHGWALLASSNFKAAAAAFERSLAIAPSADAEVGLATAARKMGGGARAIEALRRALALEPDNADSWNELGGLLLQREEVEPAIAAFERAVSLKPKDEMYRRNLEFARGIRKPREN